MNFEPRLKRPNKNNKYYIRRCSGGYSRAIEGKCRDTGCCDTQCDTLANCVGYAYGRFHEIIGDTTMSYCSPVNAEDMPEYATKCQKGSEPKLGSIIVWKQGKLKCNTDGVGHVAVVENINSDGSIVISQSGYNSKVFWTETLKKGDGNWRPSWMNKTYEFRCFIYNPAVYCPVNNLDLMYNNKKYTVRNIVKNEENYIRLADARDVLQLCDVDWDCVNGVVITRKCSKQCKGTGNLQVTLNTPSYHKVNAESYNNENYVRLRDFDEVLDLATVKYNTSKRIVEVKSK